MISDKSPIKSIWAEIFEYLPITFGLTDSLFKDSFRVRLGDFDNYLISLKFFILSSLPDPDIYKILGEIFFLDPITFFRIL